MDSSKDQPIKEALADEQATSLDDAMKELGGDVAHMKRAAAWWLETRVDAVKTGLRRTAFKLVLVLTFLITAVSAIVALVVLFISGVANGLTTAVGGRIWLGNLLTVLLLVGTPIIAIQMMIRRAQTTRLHALANKYASKQPQPSDAT